MIRENEQNDVSAGDASRFVSYADLVRFAWRRKSFLLLGVSLGLLIGALYYVQRPPVYEATAQVLVVHKRPEVVTGQQVSRSQFEDYASTHRLLISSPIIVQRAIERDNLSTLRCLQDLDDDLQTEIIDRSRVSRVSREADGVLELSFRGEFEHECAIVVNAILASYQEFLAETYDDMSQDTVGLITEARDLLENDLAAKAREYRRFREGAPLIWSGQDEVNPRRERLEAIELQRSRLLLQKAELQGKLATIRRAKQEGRSREQLVALVSDLSEESFDTEAASRAESTLQSELLPLLLEEERLLADYGANHPYVQAVRQRIETTRNFFALPSASYISANPSEDGSTVVAKENLVDLFEEYLQNEIERIDTSENVLAGMYDEEHQKVRELSSFELQDNEYRNGIARSQALYDGLIERLQDASLVKDYGGFEAQVIAPAGKAEKVAPRLSLVGAGSLLLGLLLGGGMALGAELGDRSFHTPAEIRQRLGLPIVGSIPVYSATEWADVRDANGVRRDRMLCCYYQPRSTESEAFRSIRTALYFSGSGQKNRILQVTSPNPRDGKSTVTANLAVSIAMSNKQVLLVDADLRKPRLHEIFNMRADTGLAAVIGLDVEPADAVLDTGIENLSLMPAGPLPPDPAELLTSPRFGELLEVLRQQYDYILVDTAPLLAVTDASIVAARADGVLLTVRINQDKRLHAERARDILTSMEAKVLGVVVNALDKSGQQSYYGYGYGYGTPNASRDGREIAATR